MSRSLMTSSGSCRLEQRPMAARDSAVRLVLQVVDACEVGREVLASSSFVSASRSYTAWTARIAGQLLASSVGRVDLVDDERLRGRLDAVDHIVEVDDELVDVLAVERRDEASARGVRATSWSIPSPCFSRAWISATRSSQPVVAADHRLELAGGLEVLAVGVNRSKNFSSLGISRNHRRGLR